MTPLQKSTLKKIEESKGHVMLLKPSDFENFKKLIYASKELKYEPNFLQKIADLKKQRF
jgi:hypothetical protein